MLVCRAAGWIQFQTEITDASHGFEVELDPQNKDGSSLRAAAGNLTCAPLTHMH